MKRNINPDNKPGPELKYGKELTRTVILKFTEEEFDLISRLCKSKDTTKTNLFRDALKKYCDL